MASDTLQDQTIGYYWGTLDTNIADALRLHFNDLPVFSSALIRVLDSDPDPRTIIKVLARGSIIAHEQNSAVFVGCGELLKAAQLGIFTGFDEIWCLIGEQHPISLIPKDVCITSDAARFAQSAPERAIHAMHGLNSVLALGDGCGLNYLTTCSEFAQLLRKHYDAAS